ncbi:MAG: F0F1 ATP synthase subunit delta [Candidatus Daviesbacteria bacterium]|nr:F0F1 ATP synthase subunit delta [Candidatus Daviesbacteria bacterium]
MIKGSKQLNKIIDLFMEDSFKSSGEVNEAIVKKHVKTLKSLPIPQSIMGLSEYMRRLKLELAKTTVEIESATPLSQNQISHITRALKSDHSVSAVRSIVNPDLLGGLKIKIGDSVYDDSVSSRILQLGEAIRQ